MNKSESIKELSAALVAAQSEFPAIPRTKTVKVKSDKGSYEFKYAPFEDILRACRPVMTKHGLAYSQGENAGMLETIVMHKSGEWIQHGTKVNVAGQSAQAYGSGITYARRYGFCAAFGIQADDDDDGNTADGNHVETKTTKDASVKSRATGDAWSRQPEDVQVMMDDTVGRVVALLKKNDREGAKAELEEAIAKFDGREDLMLAQWERFSSLHRAMLKGAGFVFSLQEIAA